MKLVPIFLLAVLLASCVSREQIIPAEGKTVTAPEGRNGPPRSDMDIFIVDGIFGTRWDLMPLQRRLNREVAPSRIWRYDNSGRTSLETAAARLAAGLRATGRPFCLVGFSMGGLVIREAMRQAPDLPLRKAVLMHAPHSGSLLAHLLPLPACREMRPGSAFLRRLDAAEWDHPTLVTYNEADLMVVPGESARWSKATHVIHSSVPAHAWPLVSPSLHRSVVKFLASDEAR